MKINFELPDHITFLSLEKVPSNDWPILEITVGKLKNDNLVKNVRRVVLEPYASFNNIGYEISAAISDLDMPDAIGKYLKDRNNGKG